jgi:hypothetical protein
MAYDYEAKRMLGPAAVLNFPGKTMYEHKAPMKRRSKVYLCVRFLFKGIRHAVNEDCHLGASMRFSLIRRDLKSSGTMTFDCAADGFCERSANLTLIVVLVHSTKQDFQHHLFRADEWSVSGKRTLEVLA